MILRTLILGAFSAACISVAVLGYQSQKHHAEAVQIAEAAADASASCMTEGFETDQGFVGCLQPASYVFNETPPSRLQFFIDEVAYVLGL